MITKTIRKSEAFRIVARLLADDKQISKDFPLDVVISEINALAEQAQREEGPGVAFPVVDPVEEKLTKDEVKAEKDAREAAELGRGYDKLAEEKEARKGTGNTIKIVKRGK